MKLLVPGLPIPKPRMTRRDRWTNYGVRACVARFREYQSRIRKAYLESPEYLALKRSGKIPFFQIELSCWFWVCSNSAPDLDNLIKGVKDTLQPDLIRNDSIDVVPRYGYMGAERVHVGEKAATQIEIEVIE